jgi:alpha-beta hydrolase superfamily lysophospholipase
MAITIKALFTAGLLCGLVCFGSTPLRASVSAQPAITRALPDGVRAEEVKFDSAGLKLAGTLLLPKLAAGQRAPAVLIIPAMGQATRDGVKAGKAMHHSYRDLAEHLAAQGMIVLRYDKRCIGASECRPRGTFEDYVGDAQAAVAFLRQRAEIDPARVALFGHGEGGFFASVIASQDEKLAGVVLVSAPGRTLGKLLREQAQLRLAEEGKSEAEVQTYLARLNRVFNDLSVGKTDFAEKQLDPDDEILAGLQKLPELAVSLMINDPLQAVGAVQVPVLVLQGEKDLMIQVKDAHYLDEALQRAHNPDHTLRLLPEMDYALKVQKGTATLKAYGETSRPVDPALLSALTEWLHKRLSAANRP